jgi:DNA-binding NtrC family response regulator
MRELRRQLAELARSRLRSVLVLGETGVGKDRVARALCAAAPHLYPRLEVFNCPAVPHDHLESELFGTTRGAYPGAVERPGLVERVDGGLLFLDEIGSMTAAHQAKVLRFLESGEARRLGGVRGYRVRVAVVAAAQAGLADDVAEGRFRPDLYYRLVQDAVLRVPPLRERPEDLPLLARALLGDMPGAPPLDPGALRRLQRHGWPGNVRELRAVLAMAARRARSAVAVRDVEAALAALAAPNRSALPASAASFYERTHDLRRELLVDALRVCGGNQTRAGVMLGLHGGGQGLDLRARKRAHRKFRYWWERLVEPPAAAPRAGRFG